MTCVIGLRFRFFSKIAFLPFRRHRASQATTLGRGKEPVQPLPWLMLVALVAYRVILEPGIGQFREFESSRVHTRINL